MKFNFQAADFSTIKKMNCRIQRKGQSGSQVRRAAIEALEVRALLTAVPIPIVDPNFDQFFKPGGEASNITATLPAGSLTFDFQYANTNETVGTVAGLNGIGPSAPLLTRGNNPIINPITGRTFNPFDPISATYSDGSTQTFERGRAPNDHVDVPGWVAPNYPVSFAGISTSTDFAPNGSLVPYGTQFDATTNAAIPGTGYTNAPDEFLYLLGPQARHFNGGAHANFGTIGAGPSYQTVTQTLAGQSLEPNTVYTLSVRVGLPGVPTGPVPGTVGLEVGGLFLTATLSDEPALTPFQFTQWTETFVTGAIAPTGDITLVLGLGPNANAREIDFGNVSLTQEAYVPTTPVTAVVNTPDITTTGVASQSISVTYTSPSSSPINEGTIDRTDLAVTDRQGVTLPVSSVSTVDNADGSVTATYVVPAPQGTFSSADNNVYSITVLPNAVSDTANDPVGSASAAFLVNIPGPNQSPTGVTPLSPLDFVTEYAVTQTDNKAIAGGRQFVSSSDVSASEAVVERLNTDGTPDASFGVNGMFVFPQSSAGETDAFYAMALQPDGKIVAVGTRNNDLLVIRLTTSGTLDPSFANGGIFPQDSVGAAGLFGVAITPDGKIVAGGSDSAGNFIVIRLNSDGSHDTTFNAGAAANSTDPATGAAIPLNPAFTAGGELIYNPGFEGNVVDRILIVPGTDSTDYQIVAIGSSAGVLALARINADGTPDVTFGGDQIALTQGLTSKPGLELIYQLAPEHLNRTQVDQPIGVALQEDGSITISAGSAHNTNVTPAVNGSSDFGVARLTAAGHLDPTFNSGGTLPGVITTDFGGGDDYANALSIDPATGQIIVVGTSYNASLTATTLGLQTAIAVYTSDGTLDTSFNGTGTETFASDISLTRAAVDTRLPVQAVSTKINPARGTVDVATTNTNPGTTSTIVRRVQVVVPFALTGSLNAVPTTLPGVASVQFTVTFTAPVSASVVASTLSDNDVVVQDPDGTQLPATLISADLADTQSLQATYQVNGASEAGLAGGEYTVSTTGAASAVQDTLGQMPVAGAIGTFRVAPNDFIPSTPAGKFPTNAVAGTLFKGPIKVVVTNMSASQTTINGPVTVMLLASPSSGSTIGAATVATVTKTIKLKAGNGKTFTLHNFSWPAGAGSYFLSSVLTANGLEQAVVASTSTPVVVAQSFIDLQNLAVTPASVKLVAGKKATAFVMLQNNGNVEADVIASVTVSNVPGGFVTPVQAVPIKLKLKPNQHKRYRVRFTSPITGTLPLAITVSTPGDTNTSNDSAVSATLV